MDREQEVRAKVARLRKARDEGSGWDLTESQSPVQVEEEVIDASKTPSPKVIVETLIVLATSAAAAAIAGELDIFWAGLAATVLGAIGGYSKADPLRGGTS